jgi:phosphoribosylanthranilate isomerase
LKVKICGITNFEDAELCAQLGADALGFIFYKKSKRYVNPDTARDIINSLPPFVIKVGVFVNEEPRIVNKIAEKVKLNIIQLHGDETPEYLHQIEYPVIKAFRVNEEFDFERIKEYKDCSFLLDAFHTNEYGGAGIKFNWNLIPDSIKDQIILAGGISKDNIESVNKLVNPYAVDLSSSLEAEPGIKDPKKIHELFMKINSIKESQC